MSELKIDNKAMLALFDRLACDLQMFAAPQRLPQGFVEIAAGRFFDEGLDGCHDVFEFVMVPTGRTGKHCVGIRISRTFNRYVTRAAKDALDVALH